MADAWDISEEPPSKSRFASRAIVVFGLFDLIIIAWLAFGRIDPISILVLVWAAPVLIGVEILVVSVLAVGSRASRRARGH
jgi:hypothetical protein